MLARNMTTSPIELETLGITLPASGALDVSHLSVAMKFSDEFRTHVTNGDIAFVRTIGPPEKVWPVQDALEIIDSGGNPAELVSARLGTLRQYDWGGGPMVFMEHETVNGVKQLGIAVAPFHFSTSNGQNNTWLQIDQNFAGSSMGHIAYLDMTVTAVTGFCTDPDGPKDIVAYVNNTEVGTVLTFPDNHDTSECMISAPMIDLNKGDKLRLRISAPGVKGRLGSFSITAYIQIRPPAGV